MAVAPLDFALHPRNGPRSRTISRAALALFVSITLTLMCTVVMAPAAAAAGCTGNAIVCENQLPGTPQAQWDVDGAGDDSIQGFATQITVNHGETVSFKIKTDASAYTIEIYRLGYYQGNGARKIADVTPSATLPQNQPACSTDPATEIFDCGTWAVSASWAVPATAVSGVYIARLHRADRNDSSHIPFIVRDDSSHSALVYQTSDPTWQAYNTYGESDFYQGLANGRAYKVSYNRPFADRSGVQARDYLFSNEYPMIRFLESNGYDMSYISGLDTDIRGNLLTNHSTFLSVGHDEYWSAGQRTNVEHARDAGVNLAFFSGNEVYWKTRWEPSEDGSSTPNRTLVCYKDTWAGTQIDPVTSTATWRDPRFGDNGHGPENALTGTLYMSNNTDLPITVSAEEGRNRLWRNTTLASQPSGASTALAAHTVGYESDEDLDNGFRPAGLIRLSTTTGPTEQYLRDFGNTVTPGTTTHHLTLYRATSGALVFGAGTIQWAWGLDTNHDGTVVPVDTRMQQATINLLADMGATATTLISGLVPTAKSTDTTAPTAIITTPSASSPLAQGSSITVTGTAADAGGGRVAGVEVSLDGGSSWHPAAGTTTFTYTGILTGTGPNTVQARAIDDSANIQSPTAKISTSATCPCSLFGDAVPGTTSAADSESLVLGTKFTSSADGFITGIRFYKGVGNTGTHVGTLYKADGTVLSTATFTNESATGWQTASFPSAIAITAGTTYVAAYLAPNGGYAADTEYFAYGGHTAGPLTALGGFANANGVYGSGTGMPTASYSQTNYYVDAIYSATDTTPLSVTATTPIDSSSSIPVTTSVTASFSRNANPGSINFTLTDASQNLVAGTTSYDQAQRLVSFTPTQALPSGTHLTAHLDASADGVGPMAAPATWSFTTAQPDPVPGVCPCSLFKDSDGPAVISADDPNSVELGTAFTADTSGLLTGVRFYKGPNNTGSHTISLWTSDGTQLATAAVSAESSTGWQTANFATPVSVTAATMYIASYRAPVGRYSYQAGGLSLPLDRTPLHTPANAGRYGYGTGAPLSTSGSNYYVDPIFTVAPGAAPIVAAVTPANQSTSVSVSSAISVSFDTSVQPGSTTVTLTDPSGAVVPGATGNGSVGPSASFTPSTPLSAGTVYTVTVSGAKSLGGTPMSAPFISSFTTSGTSVCPCSLLSSSATPPLSDSGDTLPITVGLQFTADVNGFITGLRYYRDAANVGTHTGTLYTAAGNKLATLTFADSGLGWQTATFPSPVPVTAGTTYVASTFMPSGHYSVASGFFSSPVVNSPLTGTMGTYAYGPDSFPTASWNGNYYYVDVRFTPQDTAPPSVTRTSPDGSVLIQPDSSVSATFARGIDANSLQMSVKDAANTPIAGTITYDAPTTTATFQPNGPLPLGTTFTASVQASSAAGVPMAAPTTWHFSTVAAPPPGDAFSLYAATDAPATAAWSDPGPVTVGMKFSSTQSGSVTAVKFFAGDGNNGPYAVSIWALDGTKLGGGQVFGNATGWKTVLLDAPVAITAGTTYVASYRGASGHYALTTGGLAGGKTTTGPLQISTSGGAYSYPDAYPANSTGDDFFVDVVLVVPSGGSTATAPGTPTGVSAVAGNGSATVSWTAPADGGSAITRYAVTPFIGSTAQTPIVLSGSPPGTTAVVGGLTNGTAYTFTVTATNAVGAGAASSASNSVTPTSVPGAPTGVAATAGNGSATVSWTAPADGGSPISSYTVTPFIGSTAQPTSTVTGTSATVTGLTNGTAYTFTVLAANAVGAGAASAASNSVTPAAVPGAPGGVSATAANASATVGWTAPSDGGSAITSYTVTPFVGSTAQPTTTVTATNATITGLTNGTAYTFTVTAANAVGTGAASAASNPVTPAAVPGAPTAVTATAGNASATVSWTAPANNGSVITSYTITPFIGTTAQPATTMTGNPPGTSTTITGLTNGTAYTFRVTATNAVGTSAASTASNSVTLPLTAPGAPTGVTATAGNASATVSWTAPANNGSVITRYTITPYIGTTAQTARTVTGTPPATTLSVTGLTNGTAYTFTVTATNAVGTSAASAASNSVTPATVPGAPTGVTATAGNASATVSWTAPANNGSVIRSYTITPFIGTTAQTATTITGNPPGTSTTITGLTNGTAYTFRVTATNAVGAGAASTASAAVTPAAVPGAPTGVTATAGNTSATVSWTAPANGGSVITSYTITPFIGTTAQTARTVTGTPPVTTLSVTGLTNGTAYTFTVTANNAKGAGAASVASNAVTPFVPTFVQQRSAHSTAAASISATPTANITAGNRLVVLVGVKNASTTTAQTVTDSAGNAYVRVLQTRASDNTEMTVWTAPVTKGGGTKPTITATPSGSAALGIQVLEYSGLSAVADASAVDQSRSATGTTGLIAATVQSGATAATTAANQLAIGFYIDGGFGRTLASGSGFTLRSNVSPATDMEFLAEDQISALGATPNAGAQTGAGARTTWLMATVVFKHA